MSQDRTPAKADESRAEKAPDFGRTFRYALIICALVEFVAIALVVYHKVSR